MLEPYNKINLISRYQVYRDTRRYDKALAAVDEVLALFPGDSGVLVDRMIILFKGGDVKAAENLADRLLEADSSLTDPFYVKAYIAERKGRIQDAIGWYSAFLARSPKPSDAKLATHRRDSLSTLLHPKPDSATQSP